MISLLHVVFYSRVEGLVGLPVFSGSGDRYVSDRQTAANLAVEEQETGASERSVIAGGTCGLLPLSRTREAGNYHNHRHDREHEF